MTVRSAVLAPVRTAHDVAIMALGVMVAFWPLVILYLVAKAVF